MNEAYVLIILIFNLSLGHSYQSQGIGIQIKGNNVTITWNKPSSDIKSTKLEVNNIVRNKTVYRADLNGTDSLHTVQLSPCQKYKVKLRFVNLLGGKHETDNTFILGGKYLYTSLDTNITFTIPKLSVYFYTVVSPTRKSILEVQGKSVIVNNDEGSRYKIKMTAQDLNISVQLVRQVDGGMFKAENSSGEGKCVVVFVTDKPTTPSLSYNEYPFVGNKANFTCISKVQRWPSDNSENLSSKYYWNRENRQPNTILSRSDKGTSVTCQVTDDRGQESPSSNIIILDPYYGPGNVHIQHIYKQFTVTEGQTFGPVNCSADCYPECNYEWRHLGRVQSYSPVLHISTIDRKQTGVYGCYVMHPNNTDKSIALNITVSVRYSPVFRQLTFNTGHKKDNMRSSIEGESLKLVMYIESFPVSMINLHSPDNLVHPLVCTIDQQVHSYTTHIEGLKCEEPGNYTIEANNGIGEATRSSFDLDIQCKPKSIMFQRSRVAIRLNSIEEITLFVVSNPKPNVTWIQNSPYPWTISGVGVNHKYFLQSTIKISKYPLNQQLGLSICNRIGCKIEHIKTVPKGKPDGVKNITIVNIAPYLAQISWYSGFDGGAPQNFSINLESTTDGSRTITVPSVERDERDLVLIMISGLSTDAYYNGHIVSCNKYGKTEVEFEFETQEANNGLSKRETIIYPLIICGIIGHIIVVFVIIFKYKEKYIDSKLQILQTGNTVTTNTLVMYDNASHTPSTNNKQSKLGQHASMNGTESKVVDKEWLKNDDKRMAYSNDETSADSKSCSNSGDYYDNETDDTHENDTTQIYRAENCGKGDKFYEEMKRSNIAGESDYDALKK
ncbi:protein Obscurin-like isoform X1 [Mytilus edulis]|uniref:protein Obscurin-like isoform X1 n=1 Tax=Mytilus edulis TaxID=6550 RepID=UPI0039EE9828